MYKKFPRAAGLVTAGLLFAVTSCASDEPDASSTTPAETPAEENTPEEVSQDETPEDEAGQGENGSPAAEESSPQEVEPGVFLYEEETAWLDDIDRDPERGLGELEGSGHALAPNGEGWPVTGVIDLSTLETHGEEVEREGLGGATVDCSSGWSDTKHMWLRNVTGPNYPEHDGHYDYQEGATSGPTCFTSGSAGPEAPGLRLIHYVCQAPHTTARVLVAETESDEPVWTPEFTTGEERQCFAFKQDQVLAYESKVTPSS